MLSILIFTQLLRTCISLAYPVTDLTSAHPLSVNPRDTTLSASDLTCPRSTWEIIWTCFVTIFACTWTSIHPNIPHWKERQGETLYRRVKLMLYALLTPEIVLVWAVRQRIFATKIANEYQGKNLVVDLVLKLLNQYATDQEWTQTHGFFLQMGGFVLYKKGEPAYAILPTRFKQLLSNNEIDFPKVKANDISDRSKGDFFSKGVVILQTTWFVIQCIARRIQGLGLTELEVVTLGLAAMNGVTYALWWSKPLDVRWHVRVDHKSGFGPVLKELEDNAEDEGNMSKEKCAPTSFIENGLDHECRAQTPPNKAIPTNDEDGKLSASTNTSLKDAAGHIEKLDGEAEVNKISTLGDEQPIPSSCDNHFSPTPVLDNDAVADPNHLASQNDGSNDANVTENPQQPKQENTERTAHSDEVGPTPIRENKPPELKPILTQSPASDVEINPSKNDCTSSPSVTGDNTATPRQGKVENTKLSIPTPLATGTSSSQEMGTITDDNAMTIPEKAEQQGLDIAVVARPPSPPCNPKQPPTMNPSSAVPHLNEGTASEDVVSIDIKVVAPEDSKFKEPCRTNHLPPASRIAEVPPLLPSPCQIKNDSSRSETIRRTIQILNRVVHCAWKFICDLDVFVNLRRRIARYGLFACTLRYLTTYPFLGVMGPIRGMLALGDDEFTIPDIRTCAPPFYAPMDNNTEYNATAFGFVVGGLLGAIHCIAWFSQFPSHSEQILWRLASLLVTGSPIAIWIFTGIGASDHLPEFIGKSSAILILFFSVIYFPARLSLLVQSLVSLRSLPANAFSEIDWVTLVPHI